MAAGLHQGAGRLEKMAGATAPSSLLLRSLVAILAILFALSLHRAFISNINWDEFYFLSFVHQYRNATLSLQLQTFHVHLFGWLPLVSDNEIHQIYAARLVLWFLSVASGVLIYKIARQFCSREAALFSVLFYFGFSYVADHGLSFRYDPICAFLFLASLYLLLAADRSIFCVPLSAVLMAVAILVSIKSALYAGTIGMVFLALFLFTPKRKAAALSAVVYAAVFAASLVLLYRFHVFDLGEENLSAASAYIERTGTRALLSGPFLPQVNFIINALTQNGPIWVFVLLGLAKAGYDLLKGADRKRALLLLSFALPLVSLLFYSDTYPYFFVLLMPTVVILGGSFADVLIAQSRSSRSKVAPMVLAGTVLVIFGSAVGDYVRRLPDQTAAQAEIVASIHRMFPDPVPYIDRNSMISSYPKVGFFMSNWGMEIYRAENARVMAGLIRREQPKFLIANTCRLDLSRLQAESEKLCGYMLFEEDFETLRANFVHHWGAIYVAGKAFDLRGPSDSHVFEILIPGDYTLEAEAPVSIDGVAYQPGDQVHLDRAAHTIAASGASTHAVLRWGVNLYRPSHEPSPQPIFYEF
jgi:hypothetical protein